MERGDAATAAAAAAAAAAAEDEEDGKRWWGVGDGGWALSNGTRDIRASAHLMVKVDGAWVGGICNNVAPLQESGGGGGGKGCLGGWVKG